MGVVGDGDVDWMVILLLLSCLRFLVLDLDERLNWLDCRRKKGVRLISFSFSYFFFPTTTFLILLSIDFWNFRHFHLLFPISILFYAFYLMIFFFFFLCVHFVTNGTFKGRVFRISWLVWILLPKVYLYVLIIYHVHY